ncbi:MAG: 5-deoxyglucuronate isomerase [Spirochaetales bacterium]|nr:MAG: 5-deoxyglucuronate isomerase [Spirochaetales bacterium]
MIVKNNIQETGYTVITEEDGPQGMLLDFGILNLSAREEWKDNDEQKERAWLLIKGELRFEWDGKSAEVKRLSCFEESPAVLHVPKGCKVTITALADSEIAVEKKTNPKDFPSKLYRPEDVRSDIFGSGIMHDAAKRTVRTVFDGEINPHSNMVMGEVINHPGRWSSYPPHTHPQPEIYHYRFFPEKGFGASFLNEDVFQVKNGDTCLIQGGKSHSQVAGAGYAMYYIWMIPHLRDDRWLPTTRYFTAEHEWLNDKNVEIWPERKHGGKTK